MSVVRVPRDVVNERKSGMACWTPVASRHVNHLNSKPPAQRARANDKCGHQISKLIVVFVQLSCDQGVYSSSKMSDYEDDMDVDIAPSKDKSIQFSSDNTAGKQKRIVADLPVEAEDNLPWSILRTACISLLTLKQGREIPSQHPRRRLWSPRHPRNDQSIC